MNWSTLYIEGRTGFRADVQKRLLDSDLDIMPGYENGITTPHDMYWIPEGIELRRIKEAIGSKLMWKYRLRFSYSLETPGAEKSEKQINLSESEKALVKDMRKRMRHVA